MEQEKLNDYIKKFVDYVDHNFDDLDVVRTNNSVHFSRDIYLDYDSLENINYNKILENSLSFYKENPNVSESINDGIIEYFSDIDNYNPSIIDKAVARYIESLDENQQKELKNILNNKAKLNGYEDILIYESFRLELENFDLDTYSSNFSDAVNMIKNHDLKIAIHDITDEEWNNDLGNITSLRENKFNQLLSFGIDNDGKVISVISDEERKEIYEDVINNAELLDSGFIRLLASQNITMDSLKDNESFESLNFVDRNGNSIHSSTNQSKPVNLEVLNQLYEEISNNYHYVNSVCYLAKMNFEDIAGIYLEKSNTNSSDDNYLTIKKGEILGGIFDTNSGGGHFELTEIAKDVHIPFKNITFQIEGCEDNPLGYTPNEVYGFISRAYEITKYKMSSGSEINLENSLENFAKEPEKTTRKLKM